MNKTEDTKAVIANGEIVSVNGQGCEVEFFEDKPRIHQLLGLA